jgi:KDEL-tailed cysteine endopeptidase
VAYKYFYETNTVLESLYPYTAIDGTCNYSNVTNTGINVTTYTAVRRDDPDAMKAALELQPIKVSIKADSNAFRLYSGGIFNDTSCGTEHNHAVGLVGWGVENNVEYWILRNSWGTDWGD